MAFLPASAGRWLFCAGLDRPWQTARPMKTVTRRLLLALLLLSLLLGLVLLLALQRAPLVPAVEDGGGARLATQARLLWAQVRPGAAPAGALRLTRLTERDLNALLDQASSAQGGRLRARLQLRPDAPTTLLSLRLAGGQAWLNLQLDWTAHPQGTEPPRLARARLGDLPLPASWVEAAALAWLRRQPAGEALQDLLPMLEDWRLTPGQLWLQWRWRPEQAREAVARFVSPTERQVAQAQRHRLRELLRAHPGGLPLEEALGALARLEIAGSADERLRALFINLALHAAGRDLGHWLPEARAQGAMPTTLLLLDGRDDMAAHLLISTLLAWQGGERSAQMLGLAKELADSRVGSGFSFNDLAADLAGTRLGQLAARDPAALLARLAAGLSQGDFFPRVSDLPEFLSPREFARRYGEVGSPAYEAQMQTIRQRVANLPLFQGFSSP